jgi:hypothetical protein
VGAVVCRSNWGQLPSTIPLPRSWALHCVRKNDAPRRAACLRG